MLYPVVSKKVFEDIGLDIANFRYSAEMSQQSYLLEKILLREARWLSKNKAGVLVSFNPDEEIAFGVRVALSENDKVNPEHVFFTSFTGDKDQTSFEMILNNYNEAVKHITLTHTYMQLSMGCNGWVVLKENDQIGIYRNLIVRAKDITRN